METSFWNVDIQHSASRVGQNSASRSLLNFHFFRRSAETVSSMEPAKERRIFECGTGIFSRGKVSRVSHSIA